MSVMKYTQKYLLRVLLCVIVVIGIIGIGGLIHHHRSGKETVQASVSVPEAELPIPELSTKRSASAGHFHADGTFHAEAPSQVVGNKNASAPPRVSPTRRASRESTANKSSLGWITWKYGQTSIISLCPYIPDWTPLPEDITYDFRLLYIEQEARESLNNRIYEAKRDGYEIDLLEIIRHPVIGYVDDIPDAESLLLDAKGNPLPPFTESEYAEEELRRLVGDRDLEASADFLSQHGHYNELLLSRLSDESAFEYLYRIENPARSFGADDGFLARVYAERVVASDPGHLKARLYLADTAPRSSPSDWESALGQYESILLDHPDSAHALIEAADLLRNLERPFQSVSYFEKGLALGARHGHFSAGVAYQQLGDYKTAWVYLKKALRTTSGPLQFQVGSHLDGIESGVPLISPLPVEKLDIASEASLDLFPSNSDFAFDVPPSELEVPLVLDSDLADEAAAYDRARSQARAAAEAARREEIALMREMSQREINEFIEWAEQLMREEASQVQTSDFLAKELAAHLTGKNAQFSPKRIVRANELIKRYGYEEGLSRLSKDDPEIAIQIQLLRNQEPIPEIKSIKKE